MTSDRFEFWFNWTLDAGGALWLGLAIGYESMWITAASYLFGRWLGVQTTRWVRRRHYRQLAQMLEQFNELTDG